MFLDFFYARLSTCFLTTSRSVDGVKGRKFSPLHPTSLSRENRIDRTCFADHRRLRRSAVAMQHVSAHFDLAKRTSEFIFLNPVTRLPSNQFLLGLDEGGKFISLRCHAVKKFCMPCLFFDLATNNPDCAGQEPLSQNLPTVFVGKFFHGRFFTCAAWLEPWTGSRSPGHHPKSLTEAVRTYAPLRFAGLVGD
jgi:hypothetical protein